MNIGGVGSANPAGGQDVSLHATKTFGDEKANLRGGVFATGNTFKRPVTTGVFAEVNTNGHGLTLQQSRTPGVGSTFSENARINMLKTDAHALNANVMHSRTALEEGLKFDRVGGNMAWSHAQGHAATVGASHIPQFNITTIDAAAKANLWASPNHSTTLDLTGNASRHVSGPFSGQNNFGAGLGFTHRF